MEYKLITSWSSQRLEELVNEYLSLGWEPVGGVAICIIDLRESSYLFAQALIRK